MKYLLLIIIFACICNTAIAQCKDIGEIIEDRPLNWNDFKGTHPNDTFDAITYTRIQLQPNPDGSTTKYTAVCYFVCKTSSVKTGFLTQASDSLQKWVLAHEQGHFDLARIATEEINTGISEFILNPKRYGIEADSIRKTIVRRLTQIDERYDEETKHSRNHPEQEKWNRLIKQGMKMKKLPG